MLPARDADVRDDHRCLSRRGASFSHALVLDLLGGGAIVRAQDGADTFASVMALAMARMDRDMMAATSGDPDRDFATMMIPHHQGAIDMAEADLRFGRDPILRRLAQGIAVEQRQEIAVMQQALAARGRRGSPMCRGRCRRGRQPVHRRAARAPPPAAARRARFHPSHDAQDPSQAQADRPSIARLSVTAAINATTFSA